MTFLEGPKLDEPKEVWVAWLARLRTMNQRDISVEFAVADAEQIIRAIETFETEQAQLAFVRATQFE
jgi:hypothetical protein